MEPLEQLKILHVLQDKDKNSALFTSLVKGLNAMHPIHSVCFLKGSHERKNPIETICPEVFTLGRKVPKIFNPFLAWRIARIIKVCGVNLVHCQRHKPTVYGTLAAWIAGGNVRVMTTVHGRKRTRGASRKLTNRFVFRRISRIIAVSMAVRKDILRSNPGLNPDKVVTIYNGIDVEKYILSNMTAEDARKQSGITIQGGVLFGTVGRLAPVKGQIFLLEAFAGFIRSGANAWLVIAGTGTLENELKKSAENLAVRDRVMFLGYRNDIPMVLKALDCFVLPSLSEGHPLALLEAMASGKMVIASDVGGIPEILSGSDTGIRVVPGSVEELTLAMKKVYRMSPDERAVQGKILQRKVLECYTTHDMVKATSDIYREVIFGTKNRT